MGKWGKTVKKQFVDMVLEFPPPCTPIHSLGKPSEKKRLQGRHWAM